MQSKCGLDEVWMWFGYGLNAVRVYRGLPGSTLVFLGLLGSTQVYPGLPGSTWVYPGLPGSTQVYLAVSCESGYWKFEKWKWKINLFHFFREVKSEIKIWFTLFENWKVKDKSLSLFPRSEKWNENLIHSFREWKVKWKFLEIETEKWNFSRILEKFLEIKKIRRFGSKGFSFCRLLLWNGKTCKKSWVLVVWVAVSCLAILGDIGKYCAKHI